MEGLFKNRMDIREVHIRRNDPESLRARERKAAQDILLILQEALDNERKAQEKVQIP